MNLFQILLSVYFTFVGAYLSIVLARLLKQNGGVLKKLDEGFRQMDKGFKLIARLIVEENERTKKEILQALKE